METIQNIFIDSLNGFSLSQIPLFLFQLLSAALGAYIFQFILNKKTGEKTITHGAIIAAVVALTASIVKYSLPLSVLGAAVILLLLKGKEESRLATLGQVVVVAIGVGCGVGSIVQTVLGCIVVFGILIFVPLKK